MLLTQLLIHSRWFNSSKCLYKVMELLSSCAHTQTQTFSLLSSAAHTANKIYKIEWPSVAIHVSAFY